MLSFLQTWKDRPIKKELKEFIKLYDKINIEFRIPLLQEQCNRIGNMDTIDIVATNDEQESPIILKRAILDSLNASIQIFEDLCEELFTKNDTVKILLEQTLKASSCNTELFQKAQRYVRKCEEAQASISSMKVFIEEKKQELLNANHVYTHFHL